MESLEDDLLPRHEAAPAFGVRLQLDAAVERALRDWERDEEWRPDEHVSDTSSLDCPPEKAGRSSST